MKKCEKIPPYGLSVFAGELNFRADEGFVCLGLMVICLPGWFWVVILVPHPLSMRFMRLLEVVLAERTCRRNKLFWRYPDKVNPHPPSLLCPYRPNNTRQLLLAYVMESIFLIFAGYMRIFSPEAPNHENGIDGQKDRNGYLWWFQFVNLFQRA